MTKLAFLDTETTGLDPDQHEVWEVGLILRDEDGSERERVWQLPVDLGRADATALKIGRWYERRWPWPSYYGNAIAVIDPEQEAENERRETAAVMGEGPYVVPWRRMDEWAATFAELLDGAHLVGAVVSFDEERLRRLLRRHHACPTWHYHLIDVEALAAGWLTGTYSAIQEVGKNPDADGPPQKEATSALPPWKSDDLSRAIGVEPEDFDRHTALGDARWARAIYERVIGW